MYQKIKSKEEVLSLLYRFNQEHLFDFYDDLSISEQQNLIQQIENIDFPLIDQLKKNCLSSKLQNSFDFKEIETPQFETLETLTKQNPSAKQDLKKIGLEALQQQKVAVITLAGGDGSRLGYNKPKGFFSVLGKSLFERQAEQINELNQKVKKDIFWIIMTNPKNQKETATFFKKNQYFGLNQNSVVFYPQEVMPCIDEQGKIILEKPFQITFSPNGNGNLFSLLSKKELLEKLQSKNTEYLFICGIDNPLTIIADPIFLGYAIESQLPISNKAIVKKNPNEKVGVFIKNKNRHYIIEYSDFPQKHTQSSKTFIANIGIHCIQLDFILKQNLTSIPYHYAHKKIPFINKQKQKIDPQKPNGYKFEKFIFDYFPKAEDIGILMVSREKEFSPLKNKKGEDSIQTVEDSLKKQNKEKLIS